MLEQTNGMNTMHSRCKSEEMEKESHISGMSQNES